MFELHQSSKITHRFFLIIKNKNTYEPRHEKTNVLVCDLVSHKPGCTDTEDGYRLEILDLESRGIALCSENKGADQLHGYREADLRLCFRIFRYFRFSHDAAHIGYQCSVMSLSFSNMCFLENIW